MREKGDSVRQSSAGQYESYRIDRPSASAMFHNFVIFSVGRIGTAPSFDPVGITTEPSAKH